MADLLALQSDLKRDADGYADDFRLQYRHYQAVLSVFGLHPAQQHEGILELVHFIAQVSTAFLCYRFIKLRHRIQSLHSRASCQAVKAGKQGAFAYH